MSEIVKNTKRNRGGYLEVKQYILENFRKGDRIPSEQEFAEELGYSRYATMRALTELAAEGYVLREPGRGTFVTDAAPPASHQSLKPIAFLTCEYDQFMSVEIMRGLDTHGRNHDWAVSLLNSHYSSQRERQLLDSAHQFAGMIAFLRDDYKNLDKLNALIESGYPLVLVDRLPDNVDACWVGIDNEQAAYDAVTYLIEMGHRRIGHVTNEVMMSQLDTVRDRYVGYCRALRNAGIEPCSDYIVSSPKDLCSIEPVTAEALTLMGYIPTHKLMTLAEPPTAIFLMNDCLAAGAFEAIANHRYTIPGDISLIGIDNSPLAQMQSVPLSSVAQPFDMIGQYAGAMLEDLIEGREPKNRHIRLSGELILRSSVRHLGSTS